MKKLTKSLRYSIYLLLVLVFAACAKDSEKQYTKFELIEELEVIHRSVGGNYG